MKYIDADKLIAEIEKRIKYEQTCIENEYRLPGKAEEEIIFEYKSLSNFISSLQQEQPEVDLEKEIEKWFDMMGDSWENGEWSSNDIRSTARHFYELGLNARKEDLL